MAEGHSAFGDAQHRLPQRLDARRDRPEPRRAARRGRLSASGQQRNDQFVSGEIAWNQAGSTATPGPRFVNDRIHQLWITPHGALKAALRANAGARPGDAGASIVAFDVPGRFTAQMTIGADGLVRRVDSTFSDPVLGDTQVVTSYDEYRAVDGIQFPMRVQQTMGGFPVLDLAVKSVQVNPALDLPIPDAARNTAERVTAKRSPTASGSSPAARTTASRSSCRIG